MVKLTGRFSHIQAIKALVIGDFMLDKYTQGNVSRISPEAPVSILKVESEKMLSGGAGNVVSNLLSLGASVTALGRIGDDLEGEILSLGLKKEGANVKHLYHQKNYKTPLKNRFIADSQQVLRVDFEKLEPLSEELENKILKSLKDLIKDTQVVAISDYAKGFLTIKLISAIIEIANLNKVPVIVDPKGLDFSIYKNATILKPNLKEAYLAAKVSSNESLEKVAKILLKKTSVDKLLITRSQDGISIFDKEGSFSNFPVTSKDIKDVTGAGDTVLAMISVAIANKIDLTYAAMLANIAAGIAIEHLGCYRVTLTDLAKRLLKYDVDNKLFDDSHLFALKKVLNKKQFSLLGIDSSNGLSSNVYKTIRKLSLNGKKDLILYLTDPNPDDEFISLLSSLSEVSFIILQSENLKNLYQEIYPDEIFIMKEDEAIKLSHAKALLKSYV